MKPVKLNCIMAASVMLVALCSTAFAQGGGVTTGLAQLGGVCYADGECADGLYCVNGICSTPSGQNEGADPGYAAPARQYPLSQTTMLVGAVLVVLLLIAGYSVTGSGRPTSFSRKIHKKSKRN